MWMGFLGQMEGLLISRGSEESRGTQICVAHIISTERVSTHLLGVTKPGQGHSGPSSQPYSMVGMPDNQGGSDPR